MIKYTVCRLNVTLKSNLKNVSLLGYLGLRNNSSNLKNGTLTDLMLVSKKK